MTKFAKLIAAAVLAMSAATPVMAADSVAVLRVDRGSVMSAQGGQFSTAQTGQVLFENQRLMVTEDAAATVTYDNGCTREYKVPGVYLIEATCKAAAAVWGGSGAKMAVGMAAVGTAGAALLSNMKQADAPAISR